MTAVFDGDAITSNAGARSLRVADRFNRLFDRPAACFTDGRDPCPTGESVRTSVAWRTAGIALRYKDRNDRDVLPLDPLLVLLSGRLLEGGGGARHPNARDVRLVT